MANNNCSLDGDSKIFSAPDEALEYELTPRQTLMAKRPGYNVVIEGLGIDRSVAPPEEPTPPGDYSIAILQGVIKLAKTMDQRVPENRAFVAWLENLLEQKLFEVDSKA